MLRTAFANALQPPPSAVIEAHEQPQFERKQLSNGLDLILLRITGQPMVHVEIGFSAGRAYQRPGEEGVAHFVEHLMANALDVTKKNELLYARKLGGISADTAREHVRYRIAVENGVSDEAVDFVKELFSLAADPDRIVNQEIIEYERHRIQNELAFYSADERRLSDNQMWKMILGLDNETSIGTSQQIDAITTATLSSFIRDLYTSNRATVMIAGNFSGEFESRITQFLEGLEPRAMPPSRTMNAPLVTPIPLKVEDQVLVQPRPHLGAIRVKLILPGIHSSCSDAHTYETATALLMSRFGPAQYGHDLMYHVDLRYAEEHGMRVSVIEFAACNLDAVSKILTCAKKCIEAIKESDIDSIENAKETVQNRLYSFDMPQLTERIVQSSIRDGSIVMPPQTVEKFGKIGINDVARYIEESWQVESWRLIVEGNFTDPLAEKHRVQEILELLKK